MRGDLDEGHVADDEVDLTIRSHRLHAQRFGSAAAPLLDVAGRVDPGVGPIIDAVVEQAGAVFESADAYLDAVTDQGLVHPWSDDWERVYRSQLIEVDGGVRARASPGSVAEGRRYTATQDPYERWTHLTMPTLLLRATRELTPGAGHVVPASDRDRFADEGPRAVVVEVDANHLAITGHPGTARAIARSLASVPVR